MIAKFFGFGARKAPAQPTVPAGRRLYAIGDIHGRADLLRDLHGLILSDAAGAPAAHKSIIYVGDYVDRGIESRRVIDMILEGPLASFECIHLLGNHEKAMMDFLDDIEIGPDWLSFGGAATLYSYGVGLNSGGDSQERFLAIQANLRQRLPASHLEFLRSLKLMHVEGDYCFVHAGIRPGINLDRQQEYDLLWIRDEFLMSSKDHGKVVVHGHSISRSPQVRPNRIGIDTGAFASGRLTCLVLDGTSQSFLQTGG